MARDRGTCVRAVGTYPCQKIPISNAHVPVARNVNHHAASTVNREATLTGSVPRPSSMGMRVSVDTQHAAGGNARVDLRCR
jgi:hypothetical protein